MGDGGDHEILEGQQLFGEANPAFEALVKSDLRLLFGRSYYIRAESLDPFLKQVDGFLENGFEKKELADKLLPHLQKAIVTTNDFGGGIDIDRVKQICEKLGYGSNFLEDHPDFKRDKLNVREESNIPIKNILCKSLGEQLDNFFLNHITDSPFGKYDEHSAKLILNPKTETGEIILTDQTSMAIQLQVNIDELRSLGIVTENLISQPLHSFKENLQGRISYAMKNQIDTVLFESDHFRDYSFNARQYLDKVLSPRLTLARNLGLHFSYGDDIHDGHLRYNKKKLHELQNIVELTTFMQANGMDCSFIARYMEYFKDSRFNDPSKPQLNKNFNLQEFLKYSLGQGRFSQKTSDIEVWPKVVNKIFESAQYRGLDIQDLIETSRSIISENILQPEPNSYDRNSYFCVGIPYFANLYRGFDENTRKLIFTNEYTTNINLRANLNIAFKDFSKRLLNTKSDSKETVFVESLKFVYQTFGLKPEELQEFIRSSLELLDVTSFLEIHRQLGFWDLDKQFPSKVSKSIFTSELFEDTYVQETTIALANKYISNVLDGSTSIEYATQNLKQFFDIFRIPSEKQNQVVVSAYFRALGQNNLNFSGGLLTDFPFLENDFDILIKNAPSNIQSLARIFQLNSLDNITGFIKDNRDYDLYINKTPDIPISLEANDLPFLTEAHLNIIEAEDAKRNGVNLRNLQANEDYQKLFEILRLNVHDWQNSLITVPFENGAQIFGYKRMFAYIDRRKIDPGTHQQTLSFSLTRHDALHAFPKILELYHASGLSPDQFYGQILSQVSRDDAVYQAGTAHHYLNQIAQTMDIDLSKNLALAQEFTDIEGIGELLQNFSSPEQVFASWGNLIRYSKLTQLLGEREVLESLKSIENPTLRKYVAHLAFHRDSKVDMEAALEFATNPREFLERAASHTPNEIQDRKKPSNYIDIWNLDLTAQELVEALVEGKMDSLATFTPMEITYTIVADHSIKNPSLLLKRALGSRGKDGVTPVAGEAKDPKKLFSEVSQIFKPYGLTVQQYLLDGVLPDKTKTEIEHKLITKIFDEQIGIRRNSLKTQIYIAKIGRKSDPDMVIAGDDTVNCMPFGDGKTTVYTFNPNTGQFVLQVVKGDGKQRTIAQSVITKDIDVQKPIPEILGQLNTKGNHLIDVLPEQTLLKQEANIACDNVEVSPNFADQSGVITAIYRDFFRR